VLSQVSDLGPSSRDLFRLTLLVSIDFVEAPNEFESRKHSAKPARGSAVEQISQKSLQREMQQSHNAMTM